MYHRLFYTFVKCYLDILCYCLTKRICKLSKNRIISKHLMLLFNKYASQTICERIVFQNISCYCLTRYEDVTFESIMEFQNISCYCLTRLISTTGCFIQISKHLMLLFNKTDNLCGKGERIISKHLMLLFNIFFCTGLILLFYFKTSHVIV